MKIMAMVRPANGLKLSSRAYNFFLACAPRSSMSRSSSFVKSSRCRKCLPVWSFATLRRSMVGACGSGPRKRARCLWALRVRRAASFRPSPCVVLRPPGFSMHRVQEAGVGDNAIQTASAVPVPPHRVCGRAQGRRLGALGRQNGRPGTACAASRMVSRGRIPHVRHTLCRW